jgi:hypothetical protein
LIERLLLRLTTAARLERPVPIRRKVEGSGVATTWKFSEARTFWAAPSEPPRRVKEPGKSPTGPAGIVTVNSASVTLCPGFRRAGS